MFERMESSALSTLLRESQSLFASPAFSFSTRLAWHWSPALRWDSRSDCWASVTRSDGPAPGVCSLRVAGICPQRVLRRAAGDRISDESPHQSDLLRQARLDWGVGRGSRKDESGAAGTGHEGASAARNRHPDVLDADDHSRTTLALYLPPSARWNGLSRLVSDTPDMAAWEIWVRSTALSHFVLAHPWLWQVLETLHYFGLCLLFGTVGVFDLRVLGVAKGIAPSCAPSTRTLGRSRVCAQRRNGDCLLLRVSRAVRLQQRLSRESGGDGARGSQRRAVLRSGVQVAAIPGSRCGYDADCETADGIFPGLVDYRARVRALADVFFDRRSSTEEADPETAVSF